MPRYPIVVEVVELPPDLPPPCPIHSLGDRLTINNSCIEGKMCLSVMAQQMARLYALANGLPAPDVGTIRCPDRGKVVFQVRRDSAHWWKDALAPLTDAEVRPGT